jgi:DME family drug/metabolite transporter
MFEKLFICRLTATLAKVYYLGSMMLGDFAALGAALSWAVAPILYRKALFNTKPISANIVRCITNSLFLLLALLAFGRFGVLARLPLEAVAITIVSGLVGLAVGDTLYMTGLKSIGVAKAVPLASTYPLFSLVWATFLLSQPLALTALAGALVILFGIFLLSREKETRMEGMESKKTWSKGLFYCLATAVVWSVSVTLMDLAVKLPGATGLDANFALITLRITAVAIVLTTLAPVLNKDHSFLKVTRNSVIVLCVGGLVANGLGWFLMNYSFSNILESQAVPISSTTPLFTAIAGFMIFREKLTRNGVFGAIMIVLGVFLIFLV